MIFKSRTKFTTLFIFLLTLFLCSTLMSASVMAAISSKKVHKKQKPLASATEVSDLMKTTSVGDQKYYLIETEEDLRAIGGSSYSLADNYMLNNDITLKKEWKAIGNEKHPFTGRFDGNGFTISNLTITNKKAKYIGLFGWVEGGTIHNVTLSNVDIDSAGGKGRSIGPIVAIALDSDVSDCNIE